MNEVGNWWKDVTYEETVKIIESNIKTGEKAIDSLKENCTTLRRAYVAIGWYLRNARNRELFLEGGYRNVWEFAKDKFGYTRDEATRLIGINTKFSKGGNSPVLDDKYKEFGKSQLQEMLSLPDAKLEEVTPDMSVRQIRALKKPEPIIEEPESQQPEVAESKEVYKDTEKKEIMVQAFTYPALKEIIPALNQKIYELHENNFTAVIEVIVPVLPIRQDGLSVKDVGGIRIDLGDKYAVWPYYSFMKMYMESGLYERPGQETDLAGTAKECATPHKEPEFSPAELEEQVLDERYNIGDLPQAKDKYLYRLAKVLVSERGLRLFTFSRRYISDKTIKDEIQMLGWKKDNSIEIGEGVIAYTCADSIEFSKGNEDLGMCSYARFANQVRKVMENWNPEAAKKEEQTSTEEVCATSHAEEEQLPGQMNVQDYPETMPEVVKDEAWFVREYFDRYGSSYLPELMRICRENKSNSDRAKAAQKLIAPYGCNGNWSKALNCDFHGFAAGIDFEAGGRKLHMKYGRFIAEMLKLYDPWNSQWMPDETKEPEEVTEPEVSPEPVETVSGEVEDAAPEKPTKDSALSKAMQGQARRCLSNLGVEINAKAWKAALTTAKHMQHYLEKVLELAEMQENTEDVNEKV